MWNLTFNQMVINQTKIKSEIWLVSVLKKKRIIL